ncbi:MAG: S8 family peptidase [Bacteroidales bacterium]|nr:S8 family peptidase [Bacteroidales bacterium]
MKKITILLAAMGTLAPMLALKAVSPEDSLKYINWQNLHPKYNKAWGAGTDKAYEDLLKGKTSKTVIVAVIDNGVDINHEDLKEHVWTNTGEIPGNGIDDDNNGYIDDINGWNFLGNPEGENINQAPLEVTRLYRQYLNKFGTLDEDTVLKYSPEVYDDFKRVVTAYYEKSNEIEMQKMGFDRFNGLYKRYDSIAAKALGKESYTQKELKALSAAKKTAADSAKKFLLSVYKMGLTKQVVDEINKHFASRTEYHYNTEFCPRPVIGDNPAEWSDAAYGNNNVAGPHPDHGTMVSGIIAANRNNNSGIKGVADNVKIMAIRTVPDGDEWDKDVAKAIQYAIDNGAEIINMSFGKSFSPQKEFVDNIIKMADEKNVLLVHAAGNDSENIDEEPSFPNQYSSDSTLLATNWITVGSTAKTKKKKTFVSSYSNYGKNRVDIFAPGENIITCSPGSKYDMASGTSFSAPMVTGAAALIKSYYPELTAEDIKIILLKTAAQTDKKVLLPGTGGKNKQFVKFSSLSATGGTLDVYNALIMAEEQSKSKN